METILAVGLAIAMLTASVNGFLPHEFVPANSLIIGANTSSTELIPSGTVRSEVECLTKCPINRTCIGAVFRTDTSACHVLLANRISEAPAGTMTGLNLTADAATKLWLAENLAAMLQQLATVEVTLSPAIAVFRNSSSGSNGTVQTFTVPSTACYLIRAFGARGGTHWTVYDGSPTTTFPPRFWFGGLGAFKAGRFQLTQGTQLSIVVGQSGGNSTEMTPSYPTYPEDNAGAGGGGGSFVYRSSDSSLYLAAGGGGGGSNGYQGIAGQSGGNGTSSVGATAGYSYPGGTSGSPGSTNPATGNYHGGPGAGWSGKFATARKGPEHGDGGGSRSEGWIGGLSGGMNSGAVGGFGGGGGGSEDNGASGGGGGYSGGGAGTHERQAGGGGGSFCAGVACEGVTGGNTDSDQGLVTVQVFGPTSC